METDDDCHFQQSVFTCVADINVKFLPHSFILIVLSPAFNQRTIFIIQWTIRYAEIRFN